METLLATYAGSCQRIRQQSAILGSVARAQALLAKLRRFLMRIDAGVKAWLGLSNLAQRSEFLQLVYTHRTSNLYAVKIGALS